MVWTYRPMLIATVPLYQVRSMIGDTNSASPQMQDEEINLRLTLRASVYGAAADCCRALATAFSVAPDQTAGGQGLKNSQIAKAYMARANEYDGIAAAGGAGLPYAGGISIADKEQQEGDSDRVPPEFNIGMDDDELPVPAAGNQEPQPPSP